jgi:hypothetical protein
MIITDINHYLQKPLLVAKTSLKDYWQEPSQVAQETSKGAQATTDKNHRM